MHFCVVCLVIGVLHTDHLRPQRIAVQRVYAGYILSAAVAYRACAEACRAGNRCAGQDSRPVTRATFTISVPGALARAFYHCAHRRCAEGYALTLTARNPGACAFTCATTGSRPRAIVTTAGSCAEAATCAVTATTTSGYTHSYIRSSDEWPCTGGRHRHATAGTAQAASGRVSDNPINAVTAAIVAASSFFAITIAVGREGSGGPCRRGCQNRWSAGC
jgi:hypothetical protein